jgi:hypothetical protein
VERTAVLARGNLGVGLLRARERVVFGDRDDGTDLPVEPSDAAQINVVNRSDVSCLDSIHRDNSVTGANAIASSDDGEVRRQPSNARTGRARRTPLDTREQWIPKRGGSVGVGEAPLAAARCGARDTAPSIAATSRPPAGARLSSSSRARQLLGFGKRGRRHGGAGA